MILFKKHKFQNIGCIRIFIKDALQHGGLISVSGFQKEELINFLRQSKVVFFEDDVEYIPFSFDSDNVYCIEVSTSNPSLELGGRNRGGIEEIDPGHNNEETDGEDDGEEAGIEEPTTPVFTIGSVISIPFIVTESPVEPEEYGQK